MDYTAVCSKTSTFTKSTTTNTTAVLNVISPPFAPFAAKWDAEADRRRQLRTPENLKKLMDAQKAHNSARATAARAKADRTKARKDSKNPFGTVRSSARTADRAARSHRAEAKAGLKEAKANYPTTLATRAVQAHAVHAVPAGITSWWLSTPSDWTVWPASVSLSLIAANAAALWLGRRSPAVVVEDGLSAEERQLVERLDPSHWVQHAPDRGLGGTVTTPPQVTAAGIVCSVRLDGQWTVEKLAGAVASVRALLGCRKGLRIRITEGERGGWAVLTLGTRTAVDGASMLWTPDRQGIGVDTGTGEIVALPQGRKLIAGTSGAGKSVLLRAILAPYALDPLSTVLYLDAKGEESGLWRHCAREAIDPEDISEVVAEVVAEMLARRDLMRAQQIATWQPTEERPRLIVLVDEGADLMAMDSKQTPILPGLEQVARQGRSRLVDLLWCTQKPTVGDGIPRQIIGNMDVRVVLKTAGQSETQQVMGSGWQNHHLPGPGLAYVRGTGRTEEQSPVAVWNASDDALVTSLPARKPWRRGSETPGPTGGLSLVKTQPAQGDPAQPSASDESLTDNQRAVLRAIKGGATTNAEVSRETGLNAGSAHRAVAALEKRGLVVRTGTTISLGGAA